MSSVTRPSPAQKGRRLVVLITCIFAIVVGAVQGWLSQTGMSWGQTPAQFAADSDATLRVAGYAFSIWGLIYLAIAGYAIRQALPATGESDMIGRFGWPSAVAFVGIGAWVIAAAADAELATMVLIYGSALALIIPLLIYSGTIRALGRADRDRWLTAWPLGLLAGWLTIAAPVNLLTVATGNNVLPPSLSPTAWALLAVGSVVLIALIVTWRTRLLAFSLPIAWGLIAVFVAEQARNPGLAFPALAAAVIVLIGGVVLALGLKPGIDRARVA